MTAPDTQHSLVRFLQAPGALGAAAGEVRSLETPLSWLFFAGAEVLKLKKAVRNRWLDRSTMRRRQLDCRAEVLLNSRLAPDVYLGLVAVVAVPGGFRLVPEAQMGAGLEACEWLIRMRQLPHASQLDRRIARRAVERDDVQSLGAALLRFYRSAPHSPMTGRQYLDRFEAAYRIDREVLLDRRWATPGAAHALRRVRDELDRCSESLAARAGFAVEGHGDLRPEHVFLTRPPVVIGSLEFDPALRRVDPYDELAALCLECEMAGAPWIGTHLQAMLDRTLGNAPPPAVARLYGATRALLAARLALGHLIEPGREEQRGRWRAHAQRCVEWVGQRLRMEGLQL